MCGDNADLFQTLAICLTIVTPIMVIAFLTFLFHYLDMKRQHERWLHNQSNNPQPKRNRR